MKQTFYMLICKTTENQCICAAQTLKEKHYTCVWVKPLVNSMTIYCIEIDMLYIELSIFV